MTERYSYTNKGRTVTFTDGKGSDYAYSFDEFGRLTHQFSPVFAVRKLAGFAAQFFQVFVYENLGVLHVLSKTLV